MGLPCFHRWSSLHYCKGGGHNSRTPHINLPLACTVFHRLRRAALALACSAIPRCRPAQPSCCLSIGSVKDSLAPEDCCLAVCEDRFPDLPFNFQQQSLPGGCHLAWRRSPFPPRLDAYLDAVSCRSPPRCPLPDYQSPPHPSPF